MFPNDTGDKDRIPPTREQQRAPSATPCLRPSAPVVLAAWWRARSGESGRKSDMCNEGSVSHMPVMKVMTRRKENVNMVKKVEKTETRKGFWSVFKICLNCFGIQCAFTSILLWICRRSYFTWMASPPRTHRVQTRRENQTQALSTYPQRGHQQVSSMKLVELVGRQRLHRPDAGLRGRGPRVQRDEPRQSEGVRDDWGEAAVVRTLAVYRGRHPYSCLAVRQSPLSSLSSLAGRACLKTTLFS